MFAGLQSLSALKGITRVTMVSLSVIVVDLLNMLTGFENSLAVKALTWKESVSLLSSFTRSSCLPVLKAFQLSSPMQFLSRNDCFTCDQLRKLCLRLRASESFTDFKPLLYRTNGVMA